MNLKTHTDADPELDAELSATEATRPAGLRDRLGTFRFRLLIVAIVAVVATVFTVVGIQMRQSPAEAARAYLDAVREGDVDTALSYAAYLPTGTKAHFLVPEALSHDWSIESISVVSTEEVDKETTRAVIDATIKSGDSSTRMEMELRKFDGFGWRVGNPFVEVDFYRSPFGYVNANGVTAPVGSYSFFPGVYDFYKDADGLFPVENNHQLLALGATNRSNSATYRPEFDWEVSEKAISEAQELVNAEIDDCAAQYSTQSPFKCPFGHDYRYFHYQDESLEYPSDLQWTVKEYPKITVVRGTEAVIATDTKGTVELSGTGIALDGETTVNFTIECPISLRPRVVYATTTGIRLEEPNLTNATCDN